MALSFVRFTLNQSLIRLLHQGQHGKGNESSCGEMSLPRHVATTVIQTCCGPTLVAVAGSGVIFNSCGMCH